jgi:multicomponent Na+:H+ antiporter subunit C
MSQADVAVLVGVLFASGLFLLLDGRILRALFGLVLLSNGVNLFLLSTSGDPTGRAPPIVPADGSAPPLPAVDPLPQVLILTAIVIGFSVLAFFAMLLLRADSERKTP